MTSLYRFPGGLKLESFKHLTSDQKIDSPFIPEYLIFPLEQQIGTASIPVVEIGEQVLKGQRIAKSGSYVSSNIHASSSGIIDDIGQYCSKESGLLTRCIVVKTDGYDRWFEKMPVLNYLMATAEELEARIGEAGIIGMGGAGFPSQVKVIEAADEKVETLVINGVECEPYISCDDHVIRESAEEVIAGSKVLQKITAAKKVYLAVESDMPEAYTRLVSAVENDPSALDFEVVKVPTIYPAGAEKQLIRTLTGKWVPAHGLPIQTGVLVLNVATTVAISRAVLLGESLISRVVTIAGTGVNTQNIEVLNGTKAGDLLEHCLKKTLSEQRISFGGSMMGKRLKSTEVPILKKTNCVLLRPEVEEQTESSCIRCGDCVEVCPEQLQPQMLVALAKCSEYESLKDYRLFNCIECACCDHVCPSHIPLVKNFQQAKYLINEQKAIAARAEISKARYLARLRRLEREKNEKLESKQKKSRQSLKKESLQDEVLAAIQRAKSKRKK